MITLWEVQNLSFEEIEQKAYATDDMVPVSIKLVRTLVQRALTERRGADDVDVEEEGDR